MYYVIHSYITVDRTLSLLHSSATASGIPRDLVRNLGLLTDIYRTRVWADKLAIRRAAGVWNGQGEPAIEPAKQKRDKPLSPRENIQLSGWSALGELVRATEADLRIIAGRQEQRKVPFVRKTVHRPTAPLKRAQKLLYNVVGRSDVRPRDLKPGRTTS
jgi:hypothetical protein